MIESDRVLVDTSAWIDHLAGNARIMRALERAIDDRRVVTCGQIRQEVLQGARDEKAFARLQRDMSLWAYEAEAPPDYDAAARIYARLRWKRGDGASKRLPHRGGRQTLRARHLCDRPALPPNSRYPTLRGLKGARRFTLRSVAGVGPRASEKS